MTPKKPTTASTTIATTTTSSVVAPPTTPAAPTKPQKIYYRDILVEEVFQQVRALSMFALNDRPEEVVAARLNGNPAMIWQLRQQVVDIWHITDKFDPIEFMSSSPSLRLAAASPLRLPAVSDVQEAAPTESVTGTPSEARAIIARNRRLRTRFVANGNDTTLAAH